MIEIKENLLGKFEVTGIVGSKAIKGVCESLAEAFRRADKTVKVRAPKRLRVMGRENKWRDEKATEKQINTLRKLLKGRSIPDDLTRGAASQLIQQRVAAFNKRAA